MKINKLLIYLEKKKSKIFVGSLERINNEYVFKYDEKYFYSDNPLQIGPQLSLKKQEARAPGSPTKTMSLSVLVLLTRPKKSLPTRT